MSLFRGGMVRSALSAAVLPTIEEFLDHLRRRSRDEMYVYITGQRLRRLARDCHWDKLRDVTVASMDKWLAGHWRWRKRVLTRKTKNQYAEAALEWGKWLADPRSGVLGKNPLAGVDRVPCPHNARYRRAATIAELEALLGNCSARRRLYYLFRIYTPLRRRTLRRLTWGMLELDASPPFAATPAAINKSGRDEKHVIRADVAAALRLQRGRAAVCDVVFPLPPTLDDLRDDLARAGVQFCDDQGNRRLDFHALRRTLVKLAKAAGMSVEEAARLLNHRNPATTRKYYDEDCIDPDLGTLIERLPSLGGRSVN